MNWMRYKRIYWAISLVAILIAVFSLFNWGLKLGVDFKGGAIVEYKFSKDISTEVVIDKLKEKTGIEIFSASSTGQDTFIFRLSSITHEEKENLNKALNDVVGDVEEMRFETVGPSVGPELVRKTVYAIVVAAGAILLWVAIQFKSLKFGTSAIFAMFHDSFILIGSFSVLGHFLGAEIDFLFVTALLTTLSFSVHDTIVVFDRIREIDKKQGGKLVDVSNQALTETMVRSLNNSFTIAFMLSALLLLGGSTVKWFAVALLIGTILGTYSSPFVAVPLLVSWDKIVEKFKK